MLKIKNKNGITLIALVVTIIVLLILAVVSFKIITGNDGIMSKAESSVSETEKAKAKEQVEMFISHQVANYYEQGHSGLLIVYLEDAFKTNNENGVQIGDYFVKKKESGSARVKAVEKVASLNREYASVEESNVLKIEVYKGNKTKKKFIVEGTIGATGKVVWNNESSGENGGSGELENPEEPEIPPTPATYTVRYNANEGTGTMSDETVTYNTNFTPAACTFTKTGYHFIGWNTAADGLGDNWIAGNAQNWTYEENKTLYAKWEANTYTVVFNKNAEDATGDMEEQSFTYGTAQNLTEKGFSRSGWDFLGWSTDSTATEVTYTDGQEVQNLSENNNASVNLYAIWKKSILYLYNYGDQCTSVTGGWEKYTRAGVGGIYDDSVTNALYFRDIGTQNAGSWGGWKSKNLINFTGYTKLNVKWKANISRSDDQMNIGYYNVSNEHVARYYRTGTFEKVADYYDISDIAKQTEGYLVVYGGGKTSNDITAWIYSIWLE